MIDASAMGRGLALATVTVITLSTAIGVSEGASLRGTGSSLNRQNQEAHRHDFTFLRSAPQAWQFVEKGYLVRVHENDNFRLKDVSFPIARPAVKLFIERLSEQYRSACGEQLVVTSLTRPRSHQPRNASARSVHPTGMALDLRRPNNSKCRRWLESTLLYLEHKGVLEATLERWPPHYHLAVFPRQYKAHVARIDTAPSTELEHIVTRGETLWKIASLYETTVERVKHANGLRSSRIYPGQLLTIPRG